LGIRANGGDRYFVYILNISQYCLIFAYNILGIKKKIPSSWTNFWNSTGFERIDVPVNDAKGVSNAGLFRWKSKELLQQFAL
jgi:hypothetical protein